MLRSVVLSLLLITSLWSFTACTENQSRNNEHDSSPSAEQTSAGDGQVSALARGISELRSFRGEGPQGLRVFFESHLTHQFFVNLAVERDPQELRDLSQYHRVFHQYSLDHPDDREFLSQLSYDYYNRLVEVCANDFQTCPTLGLYTHAVYAGNVFLLADPLVSESEKDRYILFITNIGYPENNVPILERRLQWMVNDLSDDETIDFTKIQRLTNLVVYLSLESGRFPDAPIRLLHQMAIENSDNDLLVDAYENILHIALDSSDSSLATELSESYAKRLIAENNIAEILQLSNDQGLIRWKGQLQNFDVNTDWKAYYVLSGLLYPQNSGELHAYIFAELLESEAGQAKILDISLAYIFKKFVREAYRSHEQLGEIWREEFSRFGKVEPIFFDFFRRADGALAEIWNVSYKREVQRIVSEITPFYSAEELLPIKQIENHLEANIRNIVAYPTQFIVGYFASQQGDFDFQFFVLSGFLEAMIVHMNDSYFFKEHFEGQAPVMFDFVTEKDIEGLEALQSFYISLDKRILAAYELDIDFSHAFLENYVRKEIQYIYDKEDELRGRLNEGTRASQLNQYCEKIQSNNNNFNFNLSFSSAENQFFLGQVYSRYSAGSSFGTSRDIVDYVHVFARPQLRHNLTESMEQLRMELGLKINRLKLMQAAFIAQGESELATHTAEQIQNVENIANGFLDFHKQEYFKMANCLVEFEKTEKKMRIHYLQRELTFAKATYHVLKILNENLDNEISLEQARQTYPEAFENDFLQDITGAGSFIDAANEKWLGIGLSYKRNIRNYQQDVHPQIGFKKNSLGRYAFYTNKFEQRFRLLIHMKNEKEGVEYPRSRITEIPRDYHELNIMFGEGENHFFNYTLGQNQTQRQFVYRFMLPNGHRRSGYATQYFIDGYATWKTQFLNMASLAKTEAFYLVDENYDYAHYKNLYKNQMQPHFEQLAHFTENLLSIYNLNAEEVAILDDVQHRNMRRGDPLSAGGTRTPGNTLFLYDNGVNFINLGHYDIYFLVLVSYQLGLHPDFVPGLFGDGPQWDTGGDQNYLITDWLPRVPDVGGSGGPNGVVQNVDADEEYGRRKQRLYARNNGMIARDYEDINLFAIDSRAKTIIFHDLYQTVMADRGLIDAFVEWTDERKEDVGVTPYQIDLFHQSPPVETEYILPSIRARYYDFRHQFDIETLNLFKNLEIDAGEDNHQ